jgi:peptidoglycan hydrolase-like protein with peptidoglycan-binding domain
MTTRLSRQTNMMKRITLVAGICFLALIGPLRADDSIASAQQALKGQGFYYGEITGRKDADTTAAIRRYQIRNGLKITGELNAETQRSLRITGTTTPTTVPHQALNKPPDLREDEGRSEISPPQYRSPRDLSPPMYAPEPYRYQQEAAGIFEDTPYATASPDVQQRVIADAQVFLARRGFYRSDIDGIYGPGTAFALRAFQSRSGLPPTGRFDVPTLGAMGLMRRQHLPVPGRRVPRPVYRGEWIPG